MKKKMGAALLAASIPGLVFSVSAIPVALGEDASMSSSIVTEEECTWYLLNAPTELALVPADPDAEYEGEALDISATVSDFNVHSSGNVNGGTTTTHAECTFYGTGNVSRPIVDLTISDAAFDATYGVDNTADAEVSFSLNAGNALDFSWGGAVCDDKWTKATVNLHADALTDTFLTITQVANVTDPVADGDPGSNDRCIDTVTIGVTIPADMKPASPGAEYTWTGPTLTTSLDTSLVDAG